MAIYSDSSSESEVESKLKGIDRAFGIGVATPSALVEWEPAVWYASKPRPPAVLNDTRHLDAVVYKIVASPRGL